MYQGAFGTWFSWQNTLTRAAPLILTALCTALPAQLGMVIIGGEGALLIGALVGDQRGAGDAVRRRRWSCSSRWSCAGVIGGGLWIMLVGGAAPISRRQRDDLEPAAGLYRARDPQPSGRGRDARPGQPQQAVDPRDRRRQHDRQHSRHRRALGAGVRHGRGDRVLYPDLSHRVRLRRARRRRQHPRRQDRRPWRRQADPDDLLSRAAAPPASPA